MSISAIRRQAATAKNAIIFVHGLGDSGSGWLWFPQVASQLGFSGVAETNFVFPNAPTIPITVNGGMPMPGWFDIYSFDRSPSSKKDVDGILKSVNTIKELVLEQRDKYNIPPERIVLGGFSQGAALSLIALSMLEFKIGGVVALSGFCPVPETVTENLRSENLSTPVFQGHGDIDPMIGLPYAQECAEFYKGKGFRNYTFKTYAGVPHSTNEEELADVVRFISLILQ